MMLIWRRSRCRCRRSWRALYGAPSERPQLRKTCRRENELWRERALQQLEYMFEVGAEFRKAGCQNYSRSNAEPLA
jgi:hypothetical protein